MSNGTIATALQGSVGKSYKNRELKAECCRGWANLTLGAGLPEALADYGDEYLGKLTGKQKEIIKSCSPHQLGVLRSVILQAFNCPLEGGPGLGEEVGPMKMTFVGGEVDPAVRPMLTITVTPEAEAFIIFA